MATLQPQTPDLGLLSTEDSTSHQLGCMVNVLMVIYSYSSSVYVIVNYSFPTM